MDKFLVGLVVSSLWLWPSVSDGGESSRAGEQGSEQRQLLTKEKIQQAQERLKAAGLDPGPADGAMGPQTERALRTYQQQQGLPVSRALDEATLQRLQALPDAMQEAQTPRTVPATRSEQQLSGHDRSEVFQATRALPSSPAFGISLIRERSWAPTSFVIL